MARTKQTARKSTGGKAPRKQLAIKAARVMRNFCTSQQSVGRAVGVAASGKKKTSYLNHENTLAAFNFPSQHVEPVSAPFEPALSSAMTPTENWLGVNFRSCFDGETGVTDLRPSVSLRISIVLDVSGSMSCLFDNDMSKNRNTYNNKKKIRNKTNKQISKNSSGNEDEDDDSSQPQTKLQVAKKCIKSIAQQLHPQDELGVITFNTGSRVIEKMSSMGSKKSSTAKCDRLDKKLAEVGAGGGTALAQGFKAGIDMLKKRAQSSVIKSDAQDDVIVISRVIFLTDMQSGQYDEDQVLEISKDAASQVEGSLVGNIFTTILGIGVDLSVGAVQSISNTIGGRYVSVAAAHEFESIASSFLQDSVPIAFNIKVSLTEDKRSNENASDLMTIKEDDDDDDDNDNGDKDGGEHEYRKGKEDKCRFSFLQGVGHPEAAQLSPGSSHFTLSSEFASASTDGGDAPILLKIESCDNEHNLSRLLVEFEWRDLFGQSHSCSLRPPTPLVSSSSTSSSSASDGKKRYSDLNIRKALALIEFVDIQEMYMTDDSHDDNDIPPSSQFQFGQLPQEEDKDTLLEEIKRFERKALISKTWSDKCYKAKLDLEYEMSECGDHTLMTTNRIFPDTLQQIADLELIEVEDAQSQIKELTNKIDEKEKILQMKQNIEKMTSQQQQLDNSNINTTSSQHPDEYLCPITMEIMMHPVLAADGYSYEKSAIEKWISTNQRSPKTNLMLLNQTLLPNRTLQSAISDYLSLRSNFVLASPVRFQDDDGDEITYKVIETSSRKRNNVNNPFCLTLQQLVNKKVTSNCLKWVCWDPLSNTISDSDGSVVLGSEARSFSSSSSSSSSSSESGESYPFVVQELKKLVDLVPRCNWQEKKKPILINDKTVVVKEEKEEEEKRISDDQDGLFYPSSKRARLTEHDDQSTSNSSLFNCLIS